MNISQMKKNVNYSSGHALVEVYVSRYIGSLVNCYSGYLVLMLNVGTFGGCLLVYW